MSEVKLIEVRKIVNCLFYEKVINYVQPNKSAEQILCSGLPRACSCGSRPGHQSPAPQSSWGGRSCLETPSHTQPPAWPGNPWKNVLLTSGICNLSSSILYFPTWSLFQCYLPRVFILNTFFASQIQMTCKIVNQTKFLWNSTQLHNISALCKWLAEGDKFEVGNFRIKVETWLLLTFPKQLIRGDYILSRSVF